MFDQYEDDPFRLFSPLREAPTDYMRATPDRLEELRRTTILGRPVPILSAATFADTEIPIREWHVDGMIPRRTVIGMYGDGAVGKSLLALQLAVATVTGTDWLNSMPTPGPVLYLSAEDEADELHRRLAAICEGRGLNLADLADLYLIPLAGGDATLAEMKPNGSRLEETKLYGFLSSAAETIRPQLVILDTLADVFGGTSENDRAQARQFIGIMRRLCVERDTTVLVLAHPSLTGMSTGTGAAGSTAWSNSLRSRLYLSRVKDGDGREEDPNLRALTVMKSNYAASGTEVRMRWEAGRFRLETGLGGATDLGRADAQIDDVFLRILIRLEAEGRSVSPSPGPTYAPARMAEQPEAKGITAKAFAKAMNRLFEAGRIRAETRGRASKERTKIIPVGV